MHVSASLLVFLAAVSPALAAPLEPEPAPFRYRIRFLAGDLRTARVEATVRLRGGELITAPWGFPGSLPNGWATFVEDLEVRKDGVPVPVTREPPGKWKVAEPDGTTLVLRYEVRLSHDAHRWDEAGGNDARPAVIGADAVVWITKALLVLADDDDAPARVSFDLPPGWKVSTPWRPVPGEPGAFAPEDLYDLYDNVIVAGRHEHRELPNGPMTVVLAVDPALAAQRPLVERTLAATLEEYRRIFGELPPERWLVALRRDAADDGEAFARSFVQMFRSTDLEGTRIVWGNVLAHELFHLWNAARLPAADPKAFEWFKEGFTEYFANRTLVRARAITTEDWLQKVGFHLGRYWGSRHLSPPPRPSLEEAGKAKMANWRLVYGGGATLGLLLDVELRAASGGRGSLDDVMRRLERRHSETGKPFTTADLLAILGEVGGRDFAPFHAAYVAGSTEWPAVEATLGKAGLRVVSFADEFYVRFDPGAGAEARRLRAALLGAGRARR